jgi:hypothetical protein
MPSGIRENICAIAPLFLLPAAADTLVCCCWLRLAVVVTSPFARLPGVFFGGVPNPSSAAAPYPHFPAANWSSMALPKPNAPDTSGELAGGRPAPEEPILVPAPAGPEALSAAGPM